MTVSNSFYRNNPFTWNELLKMILNYRRKLILVNFIAIFGTLITVPVPLLIPMLVDEVLLNQPAFAVNFMNKILPNSLHIPAGYIGTILLLTITLRLFNLVISIWQLREFTIISKDIIFKMRQSLLLRLERISMAEYEILGSGTVASYLVTDLDTIDQFIGSAISKFLVALLSLIGTAIALLWMHWRLALFILLFNPLVIYITTLLGHRVKILKSQQNRAYQSFQEILIETLESIQQIRASNRERHYIQRIIDHASHMRHHSTAFTWQSEAASRLSFLIFLFGFDLFRALSMLMVLYAGLSIGQMLAVFAYLWFMMGPVQEVLNIQYAWQGAKAALERINRLFAIHLEPQFPHIANPFIGQRTVSIEVKNLTFAYGTGTTVLNELSFTIPAGQKVALVGASGGGKTTLVHVLLGLYVPRCGQILYQNVPIETIGMDVVRDHVSTVLQHPVLFNDTVRMNLTLGCHIEESLLWQAIEIAQLRDVIVSLPNQLDSIVGRDGVKFSGGERQRLAIARMTLTNPKVVILDEATSALDAATEARVHHALQIFLRGRTTLIVAHRLSAIKQADRVLVFEDGRIVEDGSHTQLIQDDGLYAALYHKQQVL
jgi:ATP-binding cassette subfamily C protein